ncbi:MAG: dihydroneopterin aldolase [Rhodothermales bacterium]
MNIGTVRLINAIFYAHHGVMQEEHRIGGRFEVDVSMDLDFEDAAREDALEKTVDYERVYQVTRDVVMNHQFYLIERLAYLIAEGVREVYPQLVGIEVTVRKPNPPIGATADRAEAVYRWRA